MQKRDCVYSIVAHVCLACSFVLDLPCAQSTILGRQHTEKGSQDRFEKVLRRVLRRCLVVGFRNLDGGRVPRRVLRRGAKKVLSRKYDPFVRALVGRFWGLLTSLLLEGLWPENAVF